MDITSQAQHVPIESTSGSVLSDEDVISSLTKGCEVQKNVQEALARCDNAIHR